MYKYIFFLLVISIFIISLGKYYYSTIELFQNNNESTSDTDFLDNMSLEQIKLFKLPQPIIDAIIVNLEKSNNEEDKRILAEFRESLNKNSYITSYKYNTSGRPTRDTKNYNYFNEIDKRTFKPGTMEVSMNSLRKSLKAMFAQLNLLFKADGKKNILGNEYLLKSGKCRLDNKIIDKYTYNNNIPSGNLPLFAGQRGLVPGLLESIIAFPIDNITAAITKDTDDIPYCIN